VLAALFFVLAARGASARVAQASGVAVGPRDRPWLAPLRGVKAAWIVCPAHIHPCCPMGPRDKPEDDSGGELRRGEFVVGHG
jgi:hypothetical protein